MKISSLLLLAMLTGGPLWGAALTEAKFSQVVKDVKVVARETETVSVAKINDTFKYPDLIRTGADSLAELIAPDKTVTRVGANTVFSFEKSGRAISLEQGSVLFHSPKGKGGGTIKTKGASAAVLGTTIVVTATAGGGFKAIILEGKGQITLPNGSFRVLTAGQVTFVLPGSQRFGPQLNINLSKLVAGSGLVQGFEAELPSKPVIQAAIERQLTLIATGVAEDTRLLVGNRATESTVETVDTSVLERIVDRAAERLARAKATDVVIRSPNLGDLPAHLFLDPVPFDIPALGVLNFSGFVGKNLTVESTVSQLDFTPYLNQTDFNIGASEYLSVQSLSLQLSATLPVVGTPLLQDVRLAGKLGLVIAPGASLNAFHIGNLHLLTDGAMSLNNVSINNYSGGVNLNAGLVLDLTDVGASSPTRLKLESQNDVQVAGGSYTVSSADGNATVSAGRDIFTGTSPQFQATTIQMTAARDATLTSPIARGFTTLNLNAVRNLSVASGSFTGASVAPGTAASLKAGETLTVNGTSIASVANISLSARTVNLSNIDFATGTTVNLSSQLGQLAANPNTGAASVPGHVNFRVNVNYGGDPAQLFVGRGINIGVLP